MSDLPPIDYERTEPPERKRIFTPAGVVLLVIAVAALLWVASDLASGPRQREKANRVKCAANLRLIAQVVSMYRADYGGAFPPDLQAMGASADVGWWIMTCDSSRDDYAHSVEEVAKPGHCSYVYVGADLTAKTDPKCILVLEDPANHAPEGGNVLFADGHVEFVDLPTMQFFLNELNTGFNPPRTTTPKVSEAAARQDYEKNWKARMPKLKTGVWRIPATQATTRPSTALEGKR